MLPLAFFKVKDRSMEPAVSDGDYVVVNRWNKSIKDGDVVVLSHPNKGILIIKRVWKILGNHLYVRGDNGEFSQDSRQFGSISKDLVIGKVIIRI